MVLKITQGLIPGSEILWLFSRSSGPGRHHINQIESQVNIIFNINKWKTLNFYQKHPLFNELNNKFVNGSMSVEVENKRSQFKIEN